MTMLGLHTGTLGPYTLLNNLTSCCDESSNKLDQPVISNFPFDFGVVLDPALKGLMILVLIGPSYSILFSMNYTMFIRKDFQHEYFVHRDV